MQLIIYTIIGFIAQMIDGTLGMAYGVSCRTFLKIFANVPSGVISAVVHYAEVPTSFVSMISHIKYKNVDKKILLNLLFTGIIGSIMGAYVITLDFKWIELVVDIYLIIMGIIVFKKGLKSSNKDNNSINNKYYIRILGFIGAFFDASGGGGWGPIVNSNLLSKSNNSKKIIGSVNSAEFFVTLTSSITFILFISNIKQYLIIILGLIIGGIFAAPVAAKLCQKLENKNLYFIVGLMLIVMNVYNIFLIVS